MQYQYSVDMFILVLKVVWYKFDYQFVKPRCSYSSIDDSFRFFYLQENLNKNLRSEWNNFIIFLSTSAFNQIIYIIKVSNVQVQKTKTNENQYRNIDIKIKRINILIWNYSQYECHIHSFLFTKLIFQPVFLFFLVFSFNQTTSTLICVSIILLLNTVYFLCCISFWQRIIVIK